MGQRSRTITSGRRIRHSESVGDGAWKLSVFPTALGWFALWGIDRRVTGLLIGHHSADEVRAAAQRSVGNSGHSPLLEEEDWFPSLRRQLEKFADGERIDFDDCVFDWPGLTPFQLRVVVATRQVRYGETTSYGEMAARVGSPGAARAVGSVMASNRIPIIIPCHRIVAAGGGLGGFSAPSGVSLKKQMLDLESTAPGGNHKGHVEKQNARQIQKINRELFALSNS
jgi:methylated-DNA-[protein]-cysteine S-methyltransferase